MRGYMLEKVFKSKAKGKGWKVTKRGWPDFFCVLPDGEVYFVEVKSRVKRGLLRSLTKHQYQVMGFLASRKIKCFVSDGKTLEPFDALRHSPSKKERLKRELRLLDAAMRKGKESTP